MFTRLELTYQLSPTGFSIRVDQCGREL